MASKREEILNITKEGYEICRRALQMRLAREPGPERILAATHFGGRQQWAAICQIWTELAEKHPGMGELTIYDNGEYEAIRTA